VNVANRLLQLLYYILTTYAKHKSIVVSVCHHAGAQRRLRAHRGLQGRLRALQGATGRYRALRGDTGRYRALRGATTPQPAHLCPSSPDGEKRYPGPYKGAQGRFVILRLARLVRRIQLAVAPCQFIIFDKLNILCFVVAAPPPPPPGPIRIVQKLYRKCPKVVKTVYYAVHYLYNACTALVHCSITH
jgi:hypothetical protein